MAITDINSEDRLVQATFAEHLEKALGWDNVYAWNQETFGPDGTLGRADTREAVLKRDLRAARWQNYSKGFCEMQQLPVRQQNNFAIQGQKLRAARDLLLPR